VTVTASTLRRAKTSSAVVEWAHREIFDGRLRSGDRIDVPSVSAALGVSPTPVREALMLLEREGLVATQFHRGAYVEHFDAHTLRADYYLLGVVSGIACARTAQQRDSAVVEQLQQLLTDLRAATDEDVRSELSGAILRLQHRSGGTPRLLAQLRSSGRFLAWMVGRSDDRGPEEIVAAHATVIEHIAAGRSKAASDARLDEARAVCELVIAELVKRGVIDAP
jgi:DNA-binding GntR family transcriptional regulator